MNPLDENIAEQKDIIEQQIKTQGVLTLKIDRLSDKIAFLEKKLQTAIPALYKLKEELESVARDITISQQSVEDEINARKKVRALVRKHDDLHLDDEASPNSAQCWIGEWEENMEYLDTWQDVLGHAKWLVRDDA